MDKSDLQTLLEEFARAEEASAQIDTLLRSRKKVLAFPDAKNLDAFYQPIFALAELVRHLLDQQSRIQALEENQRKLEGRIEALIAERQATLLTNQAMITCIRALDQSITHLDTHKFKYSVYDLLEKINAIIKPDDRASFEIEGTGVFEAVRFSAARAAEPHLTINRLLDAGQDKLPSILPNDPQQDTTLRTLLEELRTIDGKNAERASKAQKFGLRLKVVNRDDRPEAPGTPLPKPQPEAHQSKPPAPHRKPKPRS